MKLINLIRDLILTVLNSLHYIIVLPYNLWADIQNRKFRKALKVGDVCKVDHFFMSGRQGIVTKIDGDRVELESYGFFGFEGIVSRNEIYKYKLL